MRAARSEEAEGAPFREATDSPRVGYNC